MNANEVIKALRICTTHLQCPEDCPGDREDMCLLTLHHEAARLLEAALADMKKAAPCAICIHRGTPECYARQRGMFSRSCRAAGNLNGADCTRKERRMKMASKVIYLSPPDTKDCIEILGRLIKAVGIIEKETYQIHAMEAGVKAMQEHGGKEMYIRMLQYHITHPGAYIFPDPVTKEALVAAENALMLQLIDEKKEARKHAAD